LGDRLPSGVFSRENILETTTTTQPANFAEDTATDAIEKTDDPATTEATSDATASGDGASKRLTFAQRIKIVDLLRASVEPFVGESKAEVAKLVSDKLGFAVTASTLWYAATESETGCESKLVVREVTPAAALEPAAMLERINTLERAIWTLSEANQQIHDEISQLVLKVGQIVYDMEQSDEDSI